MINLHWILPSPTPYHDFFFNRLSEESDFNLTVHFADGPIKTHPWKEKRAVKYDSRNFSLRLGIDWEVLRLAQLQHNAILVAGWHRLSLIVLLEWLSVSRHGFVFVTDTPRVGRGSGWLRSFVRTVIINRIFRSADRVLSTGRPGMNALLELGCPSAKVGCFPFFVPLPPIPQKSHTCSHKVIRFASSGRLDNAMKGYDVAIKALGLLKRNGLDNFQYEIAGTGPDLECLKSLVESNGLVDSVFFRGWLEPADIGEMLREADAFIHPARRDPFPVAVLEAMAAAKVVIGSDRSGSVVDRIVDGVNGFVHRSEDVSDLASKLTRVMLEPELARQVGSRARKTAEEWPAERGIAILREIFRGAGRPTDGAKVF